MTAGAFFLMAANYEGHGMNKANLKTLSPNEARKHGSAGGKASGQARRRKKQVREYLQGLLDGARDGVTGAEALALALYEKAVSGDVRAFEACLAAAGQAPRQTLPPVPMPEVMNAADLPRVTAAILQATASGVLAADEALKLSGVVTAHAKALELADLERRLEALEEQAEKGA